MKTFLSQWAGVPMSQDPWAADPPPAQGWPVGAGWAPPGTWCLCLWMGRAWGNLWLPLREVSSPRVPVRKGVPTFQDEGQARTTRSGGWGRSPHIFCGPCIRVPAPWEAGAPCLCAAAGRPICEGSSGHRCPRGTSVGGPGSPRL